MSKFAKDAAERGYRIRGNATDTSSLLLIWYDGPLKYASITNVGEALSGWADDTDGQTTVATWGTTGVITLTGAGTDTLGEIADNINTKESEGWHCHITGGLRATDIGDANETIDVAANTDCHITTSSGVDVYAATVGLDVHAIEAGPWNASNKATGIITELAGFGITSTAATATGTAPKVYLCKGISHADKEELVYDHSVILTTTVAQNVDMDTWTGGNGPIRGDAGDYFVIIWGTHGTTVMTVAQANVQYRALGASPYWNYRANRQ